MTVKNITIYKCDRCDVETEILSHGWLRLSAISAFSYVVVGQNMGSTADYCPKCAKLAYEALKRPARAVV